MQKTVILSNLEKLRGVPIFSKYLFLKLKGKSELAVILYRKVRKKVAMGISIWFVLFFCDAGIFAPELAFSDETLIENNLQKEYDLQSKPKSSHLSVDTLLEFSLTSLKNRAQEISKQNVWLQSEIDFYNKKIQDFKEELEGLKEKKEKLLTGKSVNIPSGNGTKEVSFMAGEESRLKEDSSQLSRENIKFEGEINLEQKQEKEIQENLVKVQQEIVQIKNKIKEFFNLLDDQNFEQEKKNLLDSLTESRKGVDIAEKQFTQSKKHSKPLGEIRDFKEKQDLSEKKFNKAQTEFNSALEEQKRISDDIHRINSQNEILLFEMNEKIGQLKVRLQKLKGTSIKAKQSLK